MEQIVFFTSFLAVVLGWLAIDAHWAGRHRRVLDVLVAMESAQLAQVHGERVAALLRRRAAGTLRRALDRVAPLVRAGIGVEDRQRLAWSGIGMTAEQFVSLRMVGAVVGAVLGAAAGALLGSPAGSLAGGCVGAAAGHVGPRLWAEAVLARRWAAIDRELLYFLDFLALGAQAGLPLDTALDQVGRELPGLLSDAFAQLQAERVMGQWSEHALASLADRLGHKEVRMVVDALTRAGRFGSRVAPLLRDLAGSIRTRRNEAAREHANRIGAAIVLPVALFILPTVVLILGYPAVSVVTGALGTR